MATSSIISTPLQKKYTPSFLNQLQAEWNEFMLEISHSTPNEIKNGPAGSVNKNAQEGLVESLNKFNCSCNGNIVIPVPLNTLKRLFSPSKCNADEVFKSEFFNEIRTNLNLTNVACKKLKKLLFSDIESSNEISDFPSPSIPSNFRKSAPPRLFFKKKPKQPSTRNDFLRIVNCFTNDKDNDNLPKKMAENAENNSQKKEANDGNLRNKQIDHTGNISLKVSGSDNFSKKKVDSVEKSTPKIVDAIRCDQDKRQPLVDNENIPKSIKKGKKNENQDPKILRKNDAKNEAKNEEENRYSSVYNLQLSGESDSSSLFYTLKHKKSVKPTIVCTYFSQVELTKIYQIVKKLGFFEIENNVSSRTTHLICGSSNKTINLCKAVARGCWILDKKWVSMSAKKERWLFEERFEKSDLCPAVKENRIKRQKYGTVYQCDVFAECSSMYVSKSCTQPSVEDIKELILLGGGRLEEKLDQASYIIGSVPKRKHIKEIWILNCILQGSIVDLNKYVKNK